MNQYIMFCYHKSYDLGLEYKYIIQYQVRKLARGLNVFVEKGSNRNQTSKREQFN